MRQTSSGRPHLGVGFPFPLRPGTETGTPLGGGLEWLRHEAAIERSIADILETSPGERVMLPGYGAGLRNHVFAPNTPPTHRDLEAAVRSALVRWEPRIEVERVQVSADTVDPNLLLIDLDFVVRRNNTAHNRVYPFYLTEGV